MPCHAGYFVHSIKTSPLGWAFSPPGDSLDKATLVDSLGKTYQHNSLVMVIETVHRALLLLLLLLVHRPVPAKAPQV
jgi:hypothetical protein